MVLKPLIEPVSKTDIVLYEGTTTLAGNIGGTTLVDAALIGSNDFLTDVTMYITSGVASLETRDITGFNPANGTITVGTAFSAQIVAGVTFKVLAFKPATAEVAEIAADIGDASSSALGSLYDILGDPAQDFLAMIGYEGATSLANKLTAARAGYLVNINNANLQTIPDISTLSAARIGYLDEINATALAQGAGSIAANAEVDSLVRAIADIVRATGSGDLAAILADVTGINGDAMRGTDNAALAATALSTAVWTAAKAAFLDENISAAKTLTVAERTAIRESVCLTGDTGSSIGKILFDLNAGLTTARMGYLDEINAAALAQGAGSVAANAEVDSLVRAIADVVRSGGSGDLAAILEYAQMVSRPHMKFYEAWNDETGIDATVWTVTDPATGVAWSRGASGAYLRATAAPNTGENARLVSDQRYIVAPRIYGTNTILRNFTLEFELKLTTPGNIEEAETFLGLTTATGHKRSNNDIIGWAILSDVLQSVSKEAANEENNTTFGETLTNWNKLKIEVYNGNIGFFINEEPVANHTTRLPSFPFYLNFYYEADGGAGATTIELGIIRLWQEDFVR